MGVDGMPLLEICKACQECKASKIPDAGCKRCKGCKAKQTSAALLRATVVGHPAIAEIGETVPPAIKVKKPPSGNALDGSSVEVAIVAGVGAMEIARTVAIVAMEIGALVAKTVNGTGSKTATSHDIQEEQRLNGPIGL